MYKRWAEKCLTNLAAAMIRRTNRRRRRITRSPYDWSVLRPVESWFDLHFYDVTIPGGFFSQAASSFKKFIQPHFKLGHRLVRQPSHPGGGEGGGLLPYMGYIGTCRGIGYVFGGSRSLNRVSFFTLLLLCSWCGP